MKTQEFLIKAALVGMGAFTAVPVMALFEPAQLETSYGVVDPDAMMLTLLQHRGVFQFLLGAGLVWAAFRPHLLVPMVVAAVIAKGVALGLVTSRPEALEMATPGILAFDAMCILLLSVIGIAHGRGVLRSSNLTTADAA